MSPRDFLNLDSDELEIGPRRYATNPRVQHGNSEQIDLGQTQRILQEACGMEPGQFTLSLTRLDDPTPAQKVSAVRMDAAIFGRLYIGGQGVAETLDVDWINGTLIVLPTGNFSLDAVYPTDTFDGALEGWRTRVGAFVYPGVRAAQGSITTARRTIRMASVPASSSSPLVLLPQRAHAVSLLLRDPTAGYGGVGVAFDRSALAGRPGAPIARVNPGGPGAMAIPDGTRSITVVNDTFSAVVPTLLFELAL